MLHNRAAEHVGIFPRTADGLLFCRCTVKIHVVYAPARNDAHPILPNPTLQHDCSFKMDK